MNKKFLSAALFGALLASTAGTFTSCKDYDDDINGLNERVDAVEKSLSELNAKFGGLAYVKSVSFADGKLTVTDEKGTPTVFNIPDKDTNTTYTMDVAQTGNKATITLTGSDGSKITKDITFTDTDTKLDPALFWMDAEGVMWYGDKNKPAECKKTGVTVPMHAKTTVAVVKKVVDGIVVGWDIVVDGVATTLNIQDVLPITGFAWIPETYYNGVEAVVFPTYAYNAVTKGAAADTTYVQSTATLSSFPGIANFHLNPASATLAQIKGGINGATMLYKGAVNHATRSAAISPTAILAVSKGILSATITADMNNAETEEGKLDMLALQLTTTAGNTFTSSYFAAYNSKEDVVFTLVDKHDLTNNTIAAEHKLVNKWSLAKNQAAAINDDNAPLDNNHHLVQVLGYDQAIKGVDLNTYVNLAITKNGKSEKIDLAKNKLSIEYVLCNYDVNSTDQINYATLTDSELKAVNYDQVDYACIGKSPIVKVTVKDTNNKNAVVAVGYIKFLYVANEMAVAPDFTAPISKTNTFDWKCFDANALDYTTDVKYMSTMVYPKVGSELGLSALSKEQFVANYTFVTDQADIPTAFKSNYIVGINEIIGTDVNADNRRVEFLVNETAISNITKDGTYTFYGVYMKNADASKVSSKFYQYPVYVAIPYVVKVEKYPTVANGLINDTKSSRIGEAWEGDVVTSKGSKGSTGVNGSALYLDVAEAIDFAKYGAHELSIDPSATTVAMTGTEWCGGHGSADWIVLKKQLTDNEEVIVPVIVKKVLCNGDKVVADKIKVKFLNPAKLALSKTMIDLKDQLSPSTTENLKNLIKITSSKDGSILFEKGALTTLGQKILGTGAVITLEKGTVTPVQWNDKFTWSDTAFTTTWQLDGQNTLAPGQKATCEINITVVFGKVAASEALAGCTITTALGGSKLTGKITVNALNAADYDAKYNK